jgi:hypothetical protein
MESKPLSVKSEQARKPGGGDLAMKAKVQAQAMKAEELSKRDNTTLIVGLAMTAVFVGMLILNALS